MYETFSPNVYNLYNKCVILLNRGVEKGIKGVSAPIKDEKEGKRMRSREKGALKERF